MEVVVIIQVVMFFITLFLTLLCNEEEGSVLETGAIIQGILLCITLGILAISKGGA